jgi:hypothetical protein
VVDVAVDLSEHSINDQVLQLLLTTHVAVKRTGDNAQTRAQGAHGQHLNAFLGDQDEGLSHHPLPGQRPAHPLIGLRSVEPQRARHCGVDEAWGAGVCSST